MSSLRDLCVKKHSTRRTQREDTKNTEKIASLGTATLYLDSAELLGPVVVIIIIPMIIALIIIGIILRIKIYLIQYDPKYFCPDIL